MRSRLRHDAGLAGVFGCSTARGQGFSSRDMSFQPLARAWRPRRFEDLVGQAHVVRALSYALDHDQLHHALLFSGTRGVGKTTLARIIAKCLNCEHGVSSQPCRDDASACATCREIDSGRFVDLIEVDAASRTGVDDTRALMDNVAYAPTVGRTKVYLIDEVHMLTKHSFNALLKTFEEPPPGVEFVLATTEPEKIPVTILSRCLQFPLKRLPVPQIAEQLRHVAKEESLSVDDTALLQIARAADGSMRDALSLVDQGLAFGGGRLDGETVDQMLGSVAGDRIQTLVGAIIDADSRAAMQALDDLYADGIDVHYVLDAIATAWQRIATIQIVGTCVDESDESWQAMAERSDPKAVQIFYDIAVAGIRHLSFAPDPLVGARMTVLRMLAFVPGERDPATQEPVGRDNAERGPFQTHASAPHPVSEANAHSLDSSYEAKSDSGHADKPASDPNSPEAQPSQRESASWTADVSHQTGRGFIGQSKVPADWHALVSRLDVSGLSAQLAANAVCEYLDHERVDLILAESRRFLLSATARDGLAAALAAFWGDPDGGPKLSIRVANIGDDTPAKRREQAEARAREAARAAIENDPFVNKLKERLGASVRPETVKPARDGRANP